MKSFFRTFFGAFAGVIVALVILFFILAGMIGSLATLSSKGETKAVTANTILKVACPITEQGTEQFFIDPMSSQFDMSTTMGLLKAVRAIDAAANDPAVSMLYICPDQIITTVTAAEELRDAIMRFRSSGKPVISYSMQMTSGTYYLASVADKVIVNTYADMMFEGSSATMLFFKDLIDKLGIDIQLVRHGKYKSAAEPFVQNDISQVNREQYERMLKVTWNAMAEGVGDSRDFTAEQYTKWVENIAIKDVKTAKELGLVDEIWYQDEVEEYLCSVCGVESEKNLNIMGIQDYAAAVVKPNLRLRDKVAVLYASGEIIMGESGNGFLGEDFVKEIRKARKDSSVKAVVFRVNSPGGSVQCSGIIAREIELLKATKPVVASFGDYAASGGYWISCGADKIFTDRSTLTGSIGVFGILPSFGNAIKKNFHINTVELSTTKHGVLVDGINKLDSDELAWMQNMMENVYSDFTGRVANCRGMSLQSVDELGQGRIWTGQDAVENGLADEIGTLQKAIEYAAASVDLHAYQIVEYPVEKTTMEKLMEMFEESSIKIKTPEVIESVTKETKWLLEIDKPTIMARMSSVPVINN